MSDFPHIPLYHIDHLVAEGGTARVYFGIDLRSGFPVAVKELKIRHLSDPTIRGKFRQVETQLYLYMRHPNIPRLIDFLDINGQLYIIMEYIDGVDLEHYIYGDIGLIPEDRALPIFLKVLDTVSYLHKNGVLHLDIKSNNVMLLPGDNIKLIDLGIASRISDAGNTTGYGTPAYMPPEQTEKGMCGPYTDIFALGILLFEMLTGRLPFEGESKKEIAYKIKNYPTPQMKETYPYINPELQRIVEHALAKEPAMRFQTCDEFKNEIIRYMRKMG